MSYEIPYVPVSGVRRVDGARARRRDISYAIDATTYFPRRGDGALARFLPAVFALNLFTTHRCFACLEPKADTIVTFC